MIFAAAIVLYAVAVLTRRRPLYYLPFLLSVCSVALVITDTAVSDAELLVVIVVDFYVFLMSLASLVIKGVND